MVRLTVTKVVFESNYWSNFDDDLNRLTVTKVVFESCNTTTRFYIPLINSNKGCF